MGAAAVLPPWVAECWDPGLGRSRGRGVAHKRPPQVPTLTRRAALPQTLPHPAALNTGGEGLLPSHHTDEEAEALSGPQGSA